MSDTIKRFRAAAPSLVERLEGHTPGPWKAFYKAKYDEWHVSMPLSDGSNMRLGLFVDGVRSENPEADAKLIAAAPELLQALIAITDQLERIGDTRQHKDGQFIAAARDAIVKATVLK